MRDHPRRAANVEPLVLCVAALLLFDAGFNLARGSTLPWRYWLLVVGASLGLAALLGAARAKPGWGEGWGLAIWLGLEGLAWGEGTLLRQLLPAVAFALLTGLLLGLQPRGRARPLTVACSFCLATLVWPRLGNALGLDVSRGAAEILWALAVFAGALLLLSIWARRAAGRVLGAGRVAVAVMLIALLGTHLAYRRARPERVEPREVADVEAAVGGASIILLVLDTVRADALSLYGAPSDTTPHLRRFVDRSERAVVYPWAFAPSNWTIPSHVSLFTGLLPSQHGAHEGTGGLRGSPFAVVQLEAESTLAEALSGRGYRTAFLTANPTLLRVRGIGRGFDVLRQPSPPRPSSLLAERLRTELVPSLLAGAVGETPKASQVADELLEFLDRGPAPILAVANFMEPHTPYTPPWSEAGVFTGSRLLREPSEARVDDSPESVALAHQRYLEEVRALDRQLGELLERLDRGGHLDSSWLVITSDHGEAFMEHGSTNHGGDVYNEQVRVPLIVQPPRGFAAPATDAPVSLVDLATTMAAIGGVRDFGGGRGWSSSSSATGTGAGATARVATCRRPR